MMLALEGLTKSYKDKVALRDITFSFTPGIYGLLGPNGAGKSTMMNLITDNLVPTSGRVLLDGKASVNSEPDTGSCWGICPSSRIYTRISPSADSCFSWHPSKAFQKARRRRTSTAS